MENISSIQLQYQCNLLTILYNVYITCCTFYRTTAVCLSASPVVLSLNVCDKLGDEELLYVLR